MELREATRADHGAVEALCAAVWPDRDVEYLDRVYPQWIRGSNRRTLVVDDDQDIVAIAQAVMVSATEAWYQGLRVHPEVRGNDVARRLLTALDDWARSQGAAVARNLVYSWNTAGMGISRGLGYVPATSFRFARPEPAQHDLPDEISRDPALAWDVWAASDARSRLSGLALDRDESWALVTCTPKIVCEAADAGGVLALDTQSGRAMAYRGRRYEGDGSSGLEYAVAAWENVGVAKTLFRALAADAGSLDVDEVRLPVPEGPTPVSDAAYARVPLDAEPHFVFERRFESVD